MCVSSIYGRCLNRDRIDLDMEFVQFRPMVRRFELALSRNGNGQISLSVLLVQSTFILPSLLIILSI